MLRNTFLISAFALVVLALAHTSATATIPMRADHCVAQVEEMPLGTPCPGCTFTFDVIEVDSEDCLQNCTFHYTYTQSCGTEFTNNSGTLPPECGDGRRIDFDCGDENDPHAGARMYCAPCD